MLKVVWRRLLMKNSCYEAGVFNSIPPIIVNKVTCNCNNDEVASSDCVCSPRELVTNGSFELPGIFSIFANWGLNSNENMTVEQSTTSYEDVHSAEFRTTTDQPTETPANPLLTQQVNVTGGCYLSFSFAEALGRVYLGDRVYFSGRVYYQDSGNNAIDLIKIQNLYTLGFAGGYYPYVYHQQSSEIPVPQNVTVVNIEFFVSINKAGNTGNTSWRLDGVSLKEFCI